MTIPDFTSTQWALALLAGLCVGVSKAGLAGMGMFTVLLIAELVPGKASSGVVLPLLIFADVMAAALYRQQILWRQIRLLALPIFAGIVAGWLVLMRLPDAAFRPVIGGMVLAMLAVQVWRMLRPAAAEKFPHAPWFTWLAGLLTGASTMIANAAGPIATIYLLIVGLPKREFVSTMAWLFLIVNLVKVPFSLNLGLITGVSLSLNVVLMPAVVVGMFTGRALVNRLPQRPFQITVLVLAALSAVRLLAYS